jgi:predicted nucleic acid-binding protein
MVTSLLDTAILVDLVRKYPPAVAWISTQKDLGVSSVVWLELLQGAQDKGDQQKALRLLTGFDRVEILQADFDWAIANLVRYGLGYHVSALDCLIASVNYRLQMPLYTRNLKHLVPLLGPLAQSPY